MPAATVTPARSPRSLVKAERLKELRSCHGWTEDEFYLARRVSGEASASHRPDHASITTTSLRPGHAGVLTPRPTPQVMPDDVHFSMFVPHCRAMLSAEQLEHWMPRIHSGEARATPPPPARDIAAPDAA